MSAVLRTPDDRFAAVPGFDHRPHYVELSDGLRMAWVETGPADGEPVLLLHGEPSWSFLYRTMLPVLAGAGLRAIAPDLIGFGRSDKPGEVVAHSYAAHVEWVREFAFDALDLQAVTLVGQDWGGLIGLRLAAEHPDRFARIVAANTGLPTGDHDMPEVWHRFRTAVQTAPVLDVGRLVAAWQRLTTSRTPMLVAFSDGDPITGAMAPVLMSAMTGAAGREHPVIGNAGHFVQEDAGPELAAAVVTFVRSTPHPAG